MTEQGNRYFYRANSERDTEALAAALVEGCHAGMVIALDGELGAGKTRFSQAFAKFLGVAGIVNSPTFTLIKEYSGSRHPLYHMDVYRLTYDEADELGLDDYFYSDGISIVEWASRVIDLLPTERLEIHISHDGQRGEEARDFTLHPRGRVYEGLCEQLRINGVIS